MKTILFVDDEAVMIRDLKRVFDDESHNYIYMTNAHDAMAYLKTHHVDLLCTDIVMKDMDGFDLLRHVKSHYPNTIRIALTAMNQTHHVKKLVNENLAQLYLFKPWHDVELKMNIYKILNMKQALYSDDIMNMLHELKDLPTLPEIYTRLTGMVANNTDVDEIAALIEEDQAIASVILRVANSAYYGRKTGSINQAIMNIGLDNLKAIVLANSVFQEMTEDMGMLLDMWQHATNANKLTTAIYSEILKKPIPSLFASVGLLHDIGKVILYHSYDDYRKILKESLDNRQTLLALEIDELGVSHQDLGAYLLNLWDLPFAYVEVAMFHHRPMDHRIINREIVSVAHIAHYYSSKYLRDDIIDQLDEKVFPILKIEKETVEDLIKHELGWRIYD